MGNSNPSQQARHKFIEIGIEENQLLSNLIIVEDQCTGERLMVKQMNIASQLEYSRLLKQMKLRKMLSEKRLGKSLIQVKQIQTKESSQICGKNYKILLYLQYLETNLKNVYNSYLDSKRHFTEEQILSILKTLISNLIILHDNNYKNIHIYKETIFLSAQHGFKIMDTQLSNKIHPYFQLLNNVPTKKGTYLAPELLHEINKKNSDFYHTPKADIFTLALIVLELCTFASYDRFYDFQKMTVDLEGLRTVVQQIEYSQYLKSILQMMLVEEEQERIGLVSLKELLSSNDIKSSQESSTFKSVSTNPRKRNTAKTFISRSKPQSKASRQSSLQKVNVQINFPEKIKTELYTRGGQNKYEENRHQTDFFTQRYPLNNTRQGDFNINANRNYATQQVIYKSIDPPVIHLQLPQNTIPVYEVRQTPKSSFRFDSKGQLTNRLKLKQFQTPINMLYQAPQPQPQSTPIRKIEVLNSAARAPNTFTTEYLSNKRYGQHAFSNGARYEGEFSTNNQFDGNGMLYYPRGKLCYSGSWQSNSFHGFGVLYNQSPIDNTELTNYENFNFADRNNWDYYQGQFNEDKKEGFGTLYMMNGDKFSGCFNNDSIQGFGTFYLAKQNRNINGIWVQNVLKR